MPGRISDTATIGAGIWCDRNVAVCCTGQGDYFIRTATAARLAASVRAGHPLQTSASDCLDEVERLGGWGGLVAVSASGEIVQTCRKFGMKGGSFSHNDFCI
jgi:isoaspartyl peptidase/L-asparaginase-like protein (Ntn-hydrolase superfamily)